MSKHQDRTYPFYIFALVLLAPLLSGCDLIEGIFKVGFWAGVIIIVIVVVVIGAIVRFIGGRT